MKNFTTDWNDGVVIAALVDATAPGLCPEYATMDPQNALENASYAMKLADDWLGVPQVRHSYNFSLSGIYFITLRRITFLAFVN